jgi:hypothetical protein
MTYSSASAHLLVLSLSAVVLAGCGAGTKATSTATAPTSPTTPNGSCTTAPVTIAHTATTANNPQLVVLNTAKYPQALCNDGTAAAYVLRPGVGAAATRWIISLQGGGECYDQTTCSNRAANSPALVSTSTYQSNPSSAFNQGGLLSSNIPTNPDFYDASMVQVLYCSSDDWSGAKAATTGYNPNDPTTWNFQGHAIVNAVVADLIASHGLSSATEVMLTGQSAGGLGVLDNVNTLVKQVPSTVRFTAYADAAFGNAVDNFSATGAAPNYLDTVDTPNEIAKREPGIILWNGSGDSVCAATATTPLAQVDCYSGQQLLAPTASGGTITLPMFISVAEKDTNQLSTDGISSPDLNSGNFTPQESGYINYFAGQMRTNLATTNGNVSLFSPDIYAHVLSTDPTLFTTPEPFPNGSLTLQQAVGVWYRTPCSAQRNIAN